MPIYEYRCASCGFQKEFLRKVTDPLLSSCPECGQESFQKMLTAAGFHLKGSGWYATDFKGAGAKPQAEKKEAVKTEASKTEATKTESTKTESTKTEATKTEATKTESARTEVPARGAGARTASPVAESGT